MTLDVRIKEWIERYATGIDRNTLGFDAWQFKVWMKEFVQAEIAREREACANLSEEKSFDDDTIIREAGIMQDIAAAIRQRKP